jgi:hypothetical protein
VGEDTDLWLRVQAAGASIAGENDARVFHCIQDYALPAAVRLGWKWQHLAPVVKRHPAIREQLIARVFWKPTHVTLPLALLGAAQARRRPWAAALAVPYLRHNRARRSAGRRGLLASTLEVPGQVVTDAAEILTLLRGSVRYRTVLL